VALSDLELLDLVERATEGRKGEPGPQGVGIRSIEQNSDDSFTVNLTDGTSKRLNLPSPRDGAPGPAGPPGNQGERGPAGQRGPAGTDGDRGLDGLNGIDGTYIDTALVNPQGRLIIGLSDGSVIDAGTVVGPAGATGSRGVTGLPGSPGADGNSILSGERAPADSLGADGDFYIDLASPQLDFYGPKRAGEWGGRRTFLKQPAATGAQSSQPPRHAPVGAGGTAAANVSYDDTNSQPYVTGGTAQEALESVNTQLVALADGLNDIRSCYGTLYDYDDPPVTITVSAPDTVYEVQGIALAGNAAGTANVTYDNANGRIVLAYTGDIPPEIVTDVNVSITVESTTNNQFIYAQLMLNGVAAAGSPVVTGLLRQTNNAQVLSMSVTTRLVNGDAVSIGVGTRGGTDDILVHSTTLNIRGGA
jgi:hypothetical protein